MNNPTGIKVFLFMLTFTNSVFSQKYLQSFDLVEVERSQVASNIPICEVRLDTLKYAEVSVILLNYLDRDKYLGDNILNIEESLSSRLVYDVVELNNVTYRVIKKFKEIGCFEFVDAITETQWPDWKSSPVSMSCMPFFEFYENGQLKFQSITDIDGLTLAYCYHLDGRIVKVQFYIKNQLIKEVDL